MADSSIILITPGFPQTESEDDCLPMIQQFVLALKRKQPQMIIDIVALHYPFKNDTYVWNGITVYSLNGRNRGSISNYLMRREAVKYIRKLCSQQKVKGIISLWLGDAAFVGASVSRITGVPHFCWMQGQDAKKGNKFVQKLNLSAAQLIAISDAQQDVFFKSYGIMPKHVIYPGVQNISLATTKKNIDLLCVGSLIPLKQSSIFIDVIHEIAKIKADVQAILIGAGPEEEKLRKQVAKLGLETNVKFTGAIRHKEVLQTMAGSKILIHPSQFEGFSGVCLEALHSGMSVISFTYPTKYPIPNWHVVVTKKQMVDKSMELLTHGYKPLATTQFSIDETARKFLELLQLT